MLVPLDKSQKKIIDLTTNKVSNRKAIDYWNDYVCDNLVEADVSKLANTTFHGAIKGCRLKNGLQISSVAASSHQVMRTKPQISKGNGNVFLIGLQLDGKGVIRQDGRECVLQPLDWTIYDSNRPYELLFEKDFRHLVVHFPKSLLPLVPEYYQYTATRFDGSKGYGKILGNLFSVAAQEMYELQETELNRLSSNMLDMLSQFLISNLNQLKNDKNFTLIKSKNFIQKNLFESDLCPKNIAGALSCSLRTLQYAYKKDGITITDFIKEERLKRVHKLLSSPSYDYYSISQLAYLVGFKSASHFSTVFTKRYGISPSSLRMSR